MKRSNLTRTTSLTTKRGLRRKPLKPKSTLLKTADIWFSKYVRLRDSTLVNGVYVGDCITCGRSHNVYANGRFLRGVNAGHFISRGHKVVRFDDKNVNLQCVYCNKWRQGEILKYRDALDVKYGAGTAAELEIIGKRLHTLKRGELENIILVNKARVAYYLSLC